MGRERIRTRKPICLCIAGLIFLSFFGCAVLEKPKRVVFEKEAPQRSEEASKIPSDPFIHARKLLEQQDYEGSLKENQKVLSLSGQNPPGDEALFNMGLIYAHYRNPKRDLGKSLFFFKKLMKDYPQSSFVEQARIWTGVLQENEKLNQTIRKLNQVIEESKQVDIEIEERRREKGR